MKPQWTADQQKVIDLRDSNILVSAAAGSGKTAVLVERIIGRITDKQAPVDIDRLLVVTFTKAAAAEMRGRIGEALQQKLEQAPDDDNLQRQIGLLHNAQITTIDSFCQHIIRNYFHVIDLDPMFQVGDETDLKIMKEAVLGEVLEQKYADARQKENQVFLDAMQMFATGRTDKEIESIVLKLYELAQSYPFPDEQLEQWKNSYALRSVEEMEQTEWMEKYIADVQMIERSGSEGTIHVSNSGYMENDAMCPERTYILSGVFGRPEKGRRAEESVPQLRTDTGKPFVGEFSIMLKAVR